MKGPFSKLKRSEAHEEPVAPVDEQPTAHAAPVEQPTTAAEPLSEDDGGVTRAYDSPLVPPADAAAVESSDGDATAASEDDGQQTVAYDGPLVPPAAEAQAAPAAEAPAEPQTQLHDAASPVAGTVPPPVAPVPTPPADTDPAQIQAAAAPSFRDRGRLRRRLAYLRRVRELGFRDLGGLVFDLHRFGRDGAALVQAKLDALAVVDRELRALERVLQDKPQYIDLREPGLAACPRCAALHGSDARFCPSCGMRLDGPQPGGEVLPPAGAPVYQPPTQPHTVVGSPPPNP